MDLQCKLGLKNRIPSKKLNSYIGVSSVTDVVRRGRLKWFGHLERKCVDDWVSACRALEVIRVEAGVGTRGEIVLTVICACLA